MAHHCHAAGCKAAVPPQMLMCKRHWFMVPKAAQSRIWATYREGQCDDWQITHEYAEAARAAVRAVAEKEGRPEDEIADACRVYDMLDPDMAAPVPSRELTTVTLSAAVARGTGFRALSLKRVPRFLRFVFHPKAKTWDALDQLDDEPREGETVFAARLADSGSMHVDGYRNGKRFGEWYKTATYELVEPQPDQSTLRDRGAWQKWATEQNAKEAV